MTATTRIQGTAFNTTHMPSLNPPPIWAKLLLSGSVSTDEGGWLLPAYSAGSPHEAARRCLVTPSRVLPASWVPTPEGHPGGPELLSQFPLSLTTDFPRKHSLGPHPGTAGDFPDDVPATTVHMVTLTTLCNWGCVWPGLWRVV